MSDRDRGCDPNHPRKDVVEEEGPPVLAAYAGDQCPEGPEAGQQARGAGN
jgi:hypothetical protein